MTDRDENRMENGAPSVQNNADVSPSAPNAANTAEIEGTVSAAPTREHVAVQPEKTNVFTPAEAESALTEKDEDGILDGDKEAEGEGDKKKRGLFKKLTKMIAAYPLQVALYGTFKVLTWVINIALTLVLVGIISGVAVCAAFIIYIQTYVDDDFKGLDNLQFESSLSTSIMYVNEAGEEVLLDTLVGTENRSWATYDEFPQDLINAFVAIEDKRFWEHPGIDYRRTANAILNFFSSSGDGSGGSTITQQLIKNVSGDDDVTIQRKVQEILRAIDVTKKYSKEEVLEMYLNTIFLSQNCYGVKTAAMEYFGKELSELNLVECAALASIPKSPTKYDPIRNPTYNLERRNLVLEQMYTQGLISEDDFKTYYDSQLELNTDSEDSYNETIHSYFVDALIDEVTADICETMGVDQVTASRMLYSGGYTIVTTLDPMVQDALEVVFVETSNDYLYLEGETVTKNPGVIPQAAMVIMDPDNGDVLGLVGGRGEKKESRGLNRATQSRRQCGSSIKPLSVYTLAIEEGLITCGTAVDDVPTMKNNNKYWPTNTPNRFYGHIDVNFAVIKSLNTIPVWLVNQLTPQKCFSFLSDTLGFESIVRSVEIGGQVYSDIALAPLALGGFTYGVTVKEMTQGYCMLANGGTTSDARMYTEIRDSRGIIIMEKDPEHRVAVSESSAYAMTGMLMNVVGQSGATGTRVTVDEKFDIEVAAKTGSTNDDRDRYFMAYTPEYVGGVWFGYDNNKSLAGFTGNPALSLWDRVFEVIYTNLSEAGVEYVKKFDVPTGMVKVSYCAVSGKLPCDSCYRDIYYYDREKDKFTGDAVMTGYFAIGTQPTEKCDCHIDVLYDKRTQAICFDGCNCPAADLITVAFRLNNERFFDSYVSIRDSDCIYKELPEGYVFPTNPRLPFFANLYEDGTYFGFSGGSNPRNRVCIEHYRAEEEEESSEENSEESSEESSEE